MIPTVEQMLIHVRELAKAFNVTLIMDSNVPPDAARSSGRRRMVITHPVIDDTTYAVTLHELGHVIAPLGHGLRESVMHHMRAGHPADRARFSLMELEEEHAAWAWARHYALDWTPAMEHLKRYAFGTYLDAHRLYHGTAPTWD